MTDDTRDLGEPRRERLRRPDPERTGPIRNMSAAFRPPGHGRFAMPEDPGRPPDTDAPPWDDATRRAVELGYQVVEEHIRQGRRHAQQRWDQSSGNGSADRDFPNPSASPFHALTELVNHWLDFFTGSRGGHPLGESIAGRSLHLLSDLTALWLDFVQNLTPHGGAPDRRGHGWQDPRGVAGDGAGPWDPPPLRRSPARRAPPTSDPAGGEAVRLSLRIESSHPTQVCLELDPQPSSVSLRTHGLRALDDDKPPLTDIEFEPDGGPPAALRIRIPDDQPPGTYSGVVLDRDTARPIGTLCIELGG